MAGTSLERQERSFIKNILDAIEKSKTKAITLVAGKVKIRNVTSAKKYDIRLDGGTEPYTDVVLETRSGKKINLSLKGESTPSIAGGGQKGLDLIVPGLANKFRKSVLKELINKQNLSVGDKVPDVYGKINSADKIKIFVGNEMIGGPIDFIYKGTMDVSCYYNESKNELTLNGTLLDANEFADKHELYLRLRSRRKDQVFDPESKDSYGIPKIYGKSKTKRESAGRIVITDKPPNNANIIRIK